MKRANVFTLSIAFIIMSTSTAFSQSNAKVIAVINKADWCPTCQKHGERAVKVFTENNKDASIQFISNDVTNDDTKKESSIELQKYGLSKVMEDYTLTGVTYFFDSTTKELISQISVSKADKDLIATMQNARGNTK